MKILIAFFKLYVKDVDLFKIEFIPSEICTKVAEKFSIGRFENIIFYENEMNKIQYESQFIDASNQLMRALYIRNKHEILITDPETGLHKLHESLGYFNQIIPKFLVKNNNVKITDSRGKLEWSPWHICRDNIKNILYIHDFKSKKIYATDDNAETYYFCIDVKSYAPVSFMLIDEYDSKLYVSHLNDNCISVWNIEENLYSRKIDILQPSYLTSDSIHLFALNHYKRTSKYMNYMPCTGSNCISIIDKKKLQVIRELDLSDKIWNLYGLALDCYANIMTVAFELKKDSNNKNVISKYASLFFITEGGSISKTISLDGILGSINDVCFTRNGLIVCNARNVQIIKFL